METDRPDSSVPTLKIPGTACEEGGSGYGTTGPTATTGATLNFPDDIDIHNVPSEFKKEGKDWFAIFNPKVKRALDVNLVHTLMHERSVYACWLLEWKTEYSFVPIVSCAASNSRQMENIWLQAVTTQRRYMTRRQVRKSGGYSSLLFLFFIFFCTFSSLLWFYFRELTRTFFLSFIRQCFGSWLYKIRWLVYTKRLFQSWWQVLGYWRGRQADKSTFSSLDWKWYRNYCIRSLLLLKHRN